MEKLVKVYEVIVDGHEDGPAGPACDGTFVSRFRTKKAADAFAEGKTYYGRPAQVMASEVSQRLARRWRLS